MNVIMFIFGVLAAVGIVVLDAAFYKEKGEHENEDRGNE